MKSRACGPQVEEKMRAIEVKKTKDLLDAKTGLLQTCYQGYCHTGHFLILRTYSVCFP